MLKRTKQPKLMRTKRPKLVRTKHKLVRKKYPVTKVCYLPSGTRFTTLCTKTQGTLLYANTCRARVIFDAQITTFADGMELKNNRYLDISPDTLVMRG